jgi:hypothetical protein
MSPQTFVVCKFIVWFPFLIVLFCMLYTAKLGRQTKRLKTWFERDWAMGQHKLAAWSTIAAMLVAVALVEGLAIATGQHPSWTDPLFLVHFGTAATSCFILFVMLKVTGEKNPVKHRKLYLTCAICYLIAFGTGTRILYAMELKQEQTSIPAIMPIQREPVQQKPKYDELPPGIPGITAPRNTTPPTRTACRRCFASLRAVSTIFRNARRN